MPISYFKINAPIFWCPPFSENYLNPQVRINKIVNKHSVDYYSSLSQLTSRIHPLIFLWTSKGFISPESYLNFFLNLHISPWLRKSFKFLILRLLANTSVSQKIEVIYFYSCPQVKLSHRFLSSPPGRRNLRIPPKQRFLKIYFFPADRENYGERYYEVEKVTKIKPTRVLVTIFDRFHHLCNLCIFGFCFIVPYPSFKHAEVWRIFN